MDKLVIIDEGIANGRWPSIISHDYRSVDYFLRWDVRWRQRIDNCEVSNK